MKQIFILSALLLSSCTSSIERREMCDKEANEYWLPMALSANSYSKGKPKIPIEGQGLELISFNGMKLEGRQHSFEAWKDTHALTGLEFDLYRKIGTNEVIVAFRGSQGIFDWLFSNFIIPYAPSYGHAKKLIEEFERRNAPLKVVLLTGHSLGGGLALSVSMDRGVDAIVFNTSPRLFDGWRNKNKPASRISVFQDTEFLKKARFFWRRKHADVIDLELYTDWRKAGDRRGTFRLHSNYPLARHLLERASNVNSDLQKNFKELERREKAHRDFKKK